MVMPMSRRKILQSGFGAVGGAALGWLPEQVVMSAEQLDGADRALLALTVAEAAARMAVGDLSASAYAEAVISAAAHFAYLNAYTSFDAEQLRISAGKVDQRKRPAAATESLSGVPLIFKDNINTVALPTSAGTPALKENTPRADAPVVAELFAAGALLAGKANLHELSSGGTSNNHTFGAVANPYDLARVPGGSSGGTAAAVAARLVPAGLGTDTAGSVRVPAALCGVVGLRPTTGRYSSAGIVPLSSTCDTAGPIARSVGDIALLDSVLAGEPNHLETSSAQQLRFGIPYDSIVADAGADVQQVFDAALASLAAAGIELVPVDLAEIQSLGRSSIGVIIGYEFPDLMAAYLDEHAPHVSMDELAAQIASPAARGLTAGRLGKRPDSTAYQEAVATRLPRLRLAHAKLYRDLGIDGLLFPTTPEVALPRDSDDSVLRDGESAFSWFYFANTALASVAGNPSLTLPAGLSPQGLPVGLSIDSLPGADRRLLSIGGVIEEILGSLPPPLV